MTCYYWYFWVMYHNSYNSLCIPHESWVTLFFNLCEHWCTTYISEDHIYYSLALYPHFRCWHNSLILTRSVRYLFPCLSITRAWSPPDQLGGMLAQYESKATLAQAVSATSCDINSFKVAYIIQHLATFFPKTLLDLGMQLNI